MTDWRWNMHSCIEANHEMYVAALLCCLNTSSDEQGQDLANVDNKRIEMAS